MRLARLALLLLATLGTCSPPAACAAQPLTAAEVRTLMADLAAASRARDVPRLAAALAPDCRIELRTLIGGREQITLLTRDDYLAMLGAGDLALRALEEYDYVASDREVTLEAEPPAATVVSLVTESFTLHQQHRVIHSEQTARLERRDGQLRVVAVSTLAGD